MRLLIHALGVTMGGAMRHLNGFLPALSTAGRDHLFRVLLREGCEASGGPNVDIYRVPERYAKNGVARLWFDNIRVPQLARRFDAAAVVSLLNIGPIRAGVPHVIMQRNALLFAPEYWRLFGPLEVMKFWMQQQLAAASMHHARCVIAPSAFMAQLIRRHANRAPDSITILPHAFAVDSYREDLGSETAHQFDRRGLKIVYPCLAGPHKGVHLLLEIARAIPPSQLVTIYLTGGDEGGNLINKARRRAQALGIENRIVFLGRVPSTCMQALYRACDLMLYVSSIESFGFPLLEALAFGLPIVAVDTPLNREICGPAAWYFDGADPEDGVMAIHDALGHWRELRDAGHKQFLSRDRSWEGYVHSLMGLVHTVLGEKALPASALQT